MQDDMDYIIRAYSKAPLLTKEQEVQLGRRVQAGDAQAKEQMILANLRLVISIATKFHNGPGADLNLADLVQEGVLGLNRAVEKFDPERGRKFSTYATWWIRKSMQDALHNHRMLHIPSQVWQQIQAMRRRRSQLAIQMGREPTVSELAESLQIDEAKLRELMVYDQPVASIDRHWADDDSAPTLADSLAEVEITEDMAMRLAWNNQVREVLESLLSQLPRREREVLIDVEGLCGQRAHTLRELEPKYEVSYERIRQIHVKAFRKLVGLARLAEDQLRGA